MNYEFRFSNCQLAAHSNLLHLKKNQNSRERMFHLNPFPDNVSQTFKTYFQTEYTQFYPQKIILINKRTFLCINVGVKKSQSAHQQNLKFFYIRIDNIFYI